MNFFSKGKVIFLLLGAVGLAGCQGQPTTTVNGNQTTISNTGVGNVNIVTNTNGNNNLTTGEGVGIEAREPDQYQATVSINVETGGTEKNASLPKLSAQVAKSGDNQRMEFALPNNEKIIYLERGNQQLLIYPQRKQYAELNQEALGFEIRELMTPEQMVKQARNLKGVERVGEEKLGDRDVIRYRYNATTQVNPQPANTQNANVQANVSTDAVVLVDKETGLPLRTETFLESQNTNVSGMNRLRMVTEMTNLQMNVDQSLFAEPTDYQKVAPEQIRSQVDLLFRTAGAFLQQFLRNQNAANQPPTVVSPTPATP